MDDKARPGDRGASTSVPLADCGQPTPTTCFSSVPLTSRHTVGYCWRSRRSRTFAGKSARIMAPNRIKMGLLP